MQNKYTFGGINLSSSENPQKLAVTVTGIIVALASLIVLFAGHLGFPITVQQVTDFAGALGTAVGTIVTVAGIIRKVIIAMSTKSVPTA